MSSASVSLQVLGNALSKLLVMQKLATKSYPTSSVLWRSLIKSQINFQHCIGRNPKHGCLWKSRFHDNFCWKHWNNWGSVVQCCYLIFFWGGGAGGGRLHFLKTICIASMWHNGRWSQSTDFFVLNCFSVLRRSCSRLKLDMGSSLAASVFFTFQKLIVLAIENFLMCAQRFKFYECT